MATTPSSISTERAIACVGSRALDASHLALLEAIGTSLVTAGWTVHSGGAQGADQAFARGAARALGQNPKTPGGLVIHLPWASYEREAADAAVRQSGGRAVLDCAPFTPDEQALALQFHPAPERLSRAGITLMTRNVRIVCPDGLEASPVHRVIAFPLYKLGGGGTGQALRLAEHFGISVHDLRNPTLRKQYAARIAALAPPKPSGPRL